MRKTAQELHDKIIPVINSWMPQNPSENFEVMIYEKFSERDYHAYYYYTHVLERAIQLIRNDISAVSIETTEHLPDEKLPPQWLEAQSHIRSAISLLQTMYTDKYKIKYNAVKGIF